MSDRILPSNETPQPSLLSGPDSSRFVTVIPDEQYTSHEIPSEQSEIEQIRGRGRETENSQIMPAGSYTGTNSIQKMDAQVAPYEPSKMDQDNLDEIVSCLPDEDEQEDELTTLNVNQGPAQPDMLQGWMHKFKQRWAKINFSHKFKECFRRIYRMIMLVLILGFIGFGFYVYGEDTNLNEEFTFSGSSLKLDIQACRIWLKKGTESEVKAYVSSKKADFFNNTETDADKYFKTTDTSLKLHNPTSNLDACDIELESSNFPDLEITCDEYECPITQDDDDLKFSGKLDIIHNPDADGNVYLKNIEVGQMFMNITGTLSIEQLALTSEADIWVDGGDIWIQSQQQSKVEWGTKVSSAYQFLGPEAYHTQAPVWEKVDVTYGNNTYTVNNCDGKTNVCQTAGCSGDHTLKLHTNDGGIYVQLLESPGKLYSVAGVSWRDDESLLHLGTDLISKQKINDVLDEVSGDVVKDQFVMMTMAGVNYDIGKWLFTTKLAYAQFKPWWLSFFSFGLLLPEPVDIDFRLVPWPLYFSGPLDTENFAIMGQLWNEVFAQFGADPDNYLLWMDAEDDDEDHWYEFNQDKHGVYARYELSLEENTPLMLALIFSFVLGLFGGVAGMIGAYFALRRFSTKFWKSLEHQRRYKRIKVNLGKRNNLDNIEEQIGEIEDDEVPGRGRVPPPFSLPDLFVVRYQKSNMASLKEFLNIIIEPEEDVQIAAQSIKLKDIKEKYEAFCFVNEYREQIIRDNKHLIFAKGFELSTQSDSTTEVFKNIRLQTAREAEEQADPRQMPNEDSLSFFVRTKCVITAFEADVIFLKDFIGEYEKFNNNLKTSHPVPVTKRAMTNLGVKFERLTLNIFRATGSNKIMLHKADELIYKPNLDPWVPKWYLYDIFAVFLHLVVLALLLLPISVALIFQQNLHSEMSTRPVDQFLTVEDIQYRPWEIPDKMNHWQVYTWIALGINALILILTFSEVINYYATQSFPFQPDSLMHPPTLLRKITQKIFYAIIYLLSACIAGYIVIGLCWCILGAVLNPEVFLPYAAASATFISFCTFKVVGSLRMFKDMLREIVFILTSRMKKMLDGMLEKVIGNIKNNSVGQIGAALASGRYMYALQKTPLGPIIGSLGIDPAMITAIANGDPIAIQMLTEKFGVDAVIIEALLAAVNRDKDALQVAIPKLASVPGIDLDPEVAKTFIMLAWKTNEVNLRTSVKVAVIQFARMMKQRYGQGLPVPMPNQAQMRDRLSSLAPNAPEGLPSQPQAGYGQQAMNALEQNFDIDPRVIEALVGMARGDTMRLLEIVREAENRELIPQGVCSLFDFMKGLILKDQTYISALIGMLQSFCGIDQAFSEGIGCLVSEQFHGFCVQRRFIEGQAKTPLIAFDDNIDQFLTSLGINDSLVIQVIMLLTRRQNGTLQRLLPNLVQYLNEKLNWNMDSAIIKSLFAMINGVNINLQNFSRRWGINPEVITCFVCMMLAPFCQELNAAARVAQNKKTAKKKAAKIGKRHHKVGNIMSAMVMEATAGTNNPEDPPQGPDFPGNVSRSVSPDLVDMRERELESSLLDMDVENLENQMKEMGMDDSDIPESAIAMQREQMGLSIQKEEEEQSPTIAILHESIRPNGDTMKYLGSMFKLSGKVVMGLFVALRGAEKRHNIYIEALTKETLRRTRLDLAHYDYCTSLIKLIVSTDMDTIKEAQVKLGLKFRELTYVAKRFMDPKDLPQGYMISKLGFASTSPLVKGRHILDWRTQPKQCNDWCKATAVAVMENSRIDMVSRFMARGQLMMAVSVPGLFIKKLMEVNCDADEAQITGIKNLLGASYIKLMTGSQRNSAVNGLSRMFETPFAATSAFVELALAPNYNVRHEAMILLLKGLDVPKVTVEKIQTVVADAKDQLQTIENNVKQFQNIGKLLGLPPVFIESLAPGMVKKLQSNSTIMLDFIKKFASEFGVNDPILQDSIGAFINGDTEGVEAFGKSIGLSNGALTNAIKLFGEIKPILMLDVVGQVLSIMGASAKVKNIAKAFAALTAEFSGRFEIEKESFFDERKVRSTAPIILGEQLKIPPLIFEGLLCSIRNETEGVKGAIIHLCNLSLGRFNMDEGFCRGFLSMASGSIEGIEDLANQIRYDADVAEVLVMLAGGNELQHTYLKQSTSFQKFCVKLGIETNKMAALIAIAKQDGENVDDIVTDLGEDKPFYPLITKSLMAVYQYATTSGQQHSRYNPYKKEKLIMDNIKPLASLYDITDQTIATFVISLVQGNAHVIQTMSERFGWSGIERSTYGALVCLFHQSPFVNDAPEDDLSPEEKLSAWLAYKELEQVCNYIGQLFRLDVTGVEKIVLAARGDVATLKWIISAVGLKGQSEAKNLIKMVIYDGDYADEDEDQEDELEEMNMDALKIPDAPQDTESSCEEIEESIGEIDLTMMDDLMNDNNQQRYAYFMEKFSELIQVLNDEYRDKQELAFTKQNVKMLWSLATGNFDNFDDFEVLLEEIHGGDCPINSQVARELLAITSGDYDNVISLEQAGSGGLARSPSKLIAGTDTDAAQTESIFTTLQMNPEDQQMEFLIKLGARDISWLEIAPVNSEQPVISKVIKDIKLGKAIFGICSLDPMSLQEYLPVLSEFLELDPEMAQILVYLSIQSLNSASNGIIPLAERLEVETQITNSFCAMAHGDSTLRFDAITTLCERLQTVRPECVNAILNIMDGDYYKGWSSLLGLVIEQTEGDPRVKLVQAIMTILSGRWDVKVPDNAFGIQKATTLGSPRAAAAASTMHNFVNEEQEAQRQTLARELGFTSLVQGFMKNPLFSRLDPETRNSIPALLVDVVIGIATNEVEIVGPVMSLFGVPASQHELIGALINLYNKNDSQILMSTEIIEKYIEKNKGKLAIPPGLVQALYGSLRIYSEVLARGIGRGLSYCASKWGADFIDPAIPQFLISIGQKQGLQDFMTFSSFKNAALVIIKKFVGVELNRQYIYIFLSLISSDLNVFIKNISQVIGIPSDAISDLYQMATPGNRFKIKNFPWITGKICSMFNLPQDVANAMLLIVSQKIEDLDSGRRGMGETLYLLISYFITKLGLPEQFLREIEDNKGQKDPAIIKILDAFFLACTDPFMYKENVLAAMPVLGSALLGNVPEEAIKLLTGIVLLFQSENSADRRMKSIQNLAEAFGIDPRIVQGLVAIAKGDWGAMEEMVARICEFNPETIHTIVQLIKRLRMAKEADVQEGNDAQESETYQQLKERIAAGADVEQIFNLLDKDGSGELDFEEFQEALKFYDMSMSQERQLQIFSKFDTDGSPQLSMQEFNAAMEHIKKTISSEAMNSLGLSKGNIIKGLLGLIAILLLLFVFIFLGIMGFTTGTTLGSVVNSLMPISAGGVLGGASVTDVTQKVKRIIPAIEKVFSVLTISDV